jgi:hypothetical protein
LIDKLTNNAWSTGKISGSDLQNYLSLANFVKTTTDALVNYYKKSETYSKTEVNTLIENVKNSRFEKVETLPATGERNVIYLLPRQDTETGNIYDEYIWVDNAWEKIASTDIDLSGYVTTQELNTALSAYMTTAAFNTAIANYYNKSEINSQMAAKVDVVAGKGLSTNDYTTTEKDKLASISPSAKKVSASTTNGNILIDDAETTVYDDSEIQGDLSTAIVETEPSNPLTFTTRSAQKAQSAEIVLEPIQDLHGYDHPWPEGGGDNLAKPLSATTEEKGITITPQSDGSVILNGTKTDDDSGIRVTSNYATVAGQSQICTIVEWPTGVVDVGFIGYGTNNVINPNSSYNQSGIQVFINQGTTLTNVKIYPQINMGTASLPFAPYSNYCPISGHTEVSVGWCGKNQLPMTVDGIKAANTSGTWSGNVYTINDGTITIKTDNDGNVTGILANGTFSSIVDFKINSNIPSGSYKMNGCPSGGAANKYFLYAVVDNIVSSAYRDYGSGVNLNANKGITQVSVYILSGTLDNLLFQPMIRLATETDSTFEPYTPSNDLTKDLGQEVFGASYNPVSGELVVTWGHIAEYNGEALPGEWISDRDVYAPNTSPSTGAEVAYELATPITYHLSPDEIKLLSGVNTIWTDGTSIKIAYRDGKVATLADLDSIQAVSSMDKLTDVELTDLADGQSLVYDGSLQKWVNKLTASIASGGAVGIRDVTRLITLHEGVTQNHEQNNFTYKAWQIGNIVFLHARGNLIGFSNPTNDLYSMLDIDQSIAPQEVYDGYALGGGSSAQKIRADMDNTIKITGVNNYGEAWIGAAIYWRVANTLYANTYHNYSTEEQVVGTWIDGKPLYEKTIIVDPSVFAVANTVSVNHGVANIDSIINYEAFIRFNSGTTKIIPVDYYTTDKAYFVCIYNCSRTTIEFVYGNWLTTSYTNLSNAYVTIKYTKITDTAQTQSNLAQLETQADAETQTVEQTEDI